MPRESRSARSAAWRSAPGPADPGVTWLAPVMTDARGEATVEMAWPERLGHWRVSAFGWSGAAQFGEAFTQAETWKDLEVRLSAPPFLTERDEATIGAD